MLQFNNHQIDAALIPLFAKNDPSVWEHIYDNYAPMMYGTILKLTQNEILAEELLEQAFLDLKRRNILSQVSNKICHKILRYTYNLTVSHLKTLGYSQAEMQTSHNNNTYLNLFLFKGTTLKGAADSTNLTEQEVKKNLRSEVNHLRNIKK